MRTVKAAKLLLFIIFISLTIALTFHFIALAAIDAPHNESSNINCGSCHGQGLLNSPFWGGSMSIDQLCLNCHTASSGPYTETNAPLVKTHSSDNTSNQYGEWSRECRNCHDPHYQEQKNYKNTDASNLYLATGIIDSYLYNVDGTSTLTYSSITYKSGWDASKIIDKTEQGGSDKRSAILFPNVKKLGYSYPVTAIDGSTITIKGDVTPVYQYISSSNFAIMYGQYVSDYVESTIVKFFDKTGTNSFADGDTTYNGVCEVCHTQTAYHRYDSTGDHSHYASTLCIACHSHIDGFGHGGGAGGGECIECHGHDAGYEYDTGKTSQGKGTYKSHSTHTENDGDDLKGPFISCDVCHDTDNYPYFKSGTDTNGDGKYNLSETDVCDNCHSPNGAFDGVDDAVIGAKANWHDGVYASPALKTGKEKWCAGCHDDQPAISKQTPIEIIIDNLDAGVSFTGTWTEGAYWPNYYGTNYRYHNKGVGDNTATWTPEISKAGYYRVYAWWPRCADLALSGKYTIYYNGGSKTVGVNQRVNSGQWNFLGTYYFIEGTSGNVVLNDNTADGYALADAVKWEYATYAPKVTGDNANYGFYVTGHKINCLDCHDASKRHIDDINRTYEIDDNTGTVINSYSESYRLTGAYKHSYSDGMCYFCHNGKEIIPSTNVYDIGKTNFWNNDSVIENSHRLHMTIATKHFDSDFDGFADSYERCIACHNVHGSPSYCMIRHGELISPPGTTTSVPALNFSYLKPNPEPLATATWTPNIPVTADYGLYAWWGVWSNRSYSDNTPYTINYNGGSQIIRLDQRVNCSQWNYLGTFNFAAGTSGNVMLSNDANWWVIADAIGFDADGDGNPDIIIDDSDPEFSLQGADWYQVCTTPDAYNGCDYQHFKRNRGIPDANTKLEDSLGGRMDYGESSISSNHVCNACHNGISYYRTPYVGPKVLQPKPSPGIISNDAGGSVLITAFILDHDDNVSTVELDLTPLGGSSNQPMYDDGTNGDQVAGDDTYSFQVSVPGGMSDGYVFLSIIATDSDTNTGEGSAILHIVDPDAIYIDDLDAEFSTQGTDWDSTPINGAYKKFIYSHDKGVGDNKALWRPDIPQAGSYNVYAWWASLHYDIYRATNAPYTINYNGGSQTIRVNQRLNGSKWNYLGTFNFDQGTTGYVELSDDADWPVLADAIKFEPVP